MQTNWFIIATREALGQVIVDSSQAGSPPYLLIEAGEGVLVFDFQAAYAMLQGFNAAVQQQKTALQALNEIIRDGDTLDTTR